MSSNTQLFTLLTILVIMASGSIAGAMFAVFTTIKQGNNMDNQAELAVEDFVNVEVLEMPPLPAGANPFHHDASSMGSNLVRGWMAMHNGFDSKENPRPLEGLYLYNSRTGQRIMLKFSKQEKPVVEKFKIGRETYEFPNNLKEVEGVSAAVDEIRSRGVPLVEALRVVHNAGKGLLGIASTFDEKVIEVIKI